MYNGAFDNRTDKEKQQDFRLGEIRASGIVEFEEREPVSYTVRNQDGSGSCVAQTTAKMLEIWDFKNDNDLTVYSATPIYQARLVKQPGMSYIDAFGFSVKKGTFLERDINSQNIDDTAIDATKVDFSKAQTIRPTNYVALPINYYAVASEIDHSGAVMVWIKCSYEEWSQDVPTGNSSSEAVRHSVCAVDKIKWNGIEYIIIEDSWGKWLKKSDLPLKDGQRAITKEFFDKHCYFAGAFTSFSFDGGVKPSWNWKKSMKYGQTSEDIKKFQEVLKYEKFFPSNQECTGFFGGITARATIKWQVAHGMNDFANETDMRKVQAGPKTLAIINNIYK